VQACKHVPKAETTGTTKLEFVVTLFTTLIDEWTLSTKATTDSADSTCTFSGMDYNKFDPACASDNTPYTTCSSKIGLNSATHPYGAWSPDYFGSVYKGSGDVRNKSSWTIAPATHGWCFSYTRPCPPPTYQGRWAMQVGSQPDTPSKINGMMNSDICKDGTTNTGWHTSPNKYGLIKKCPDNLYPMTRTVTTGGSTAGAVTFEAQIDETSARRYHGQINVVKRTTRRLGDGRRLRSLEEATDGWSVKYEHTAEAPADSGSASAAPSGADATGSKTGTTAAVAVGASALVVGAVALAALFAGRQQEEQDRELELSVALATDDSAEL
jgi:hypothetical protein